MKFFFAILIAILSSAPGFGQVAEFSIKEPLHKFPKTQEGTVLTYTYTFTNTGKAPLIISGYTVACTCTKVDLPDGPIAPGQKGTIKITFDTEGRTYYQDRVIILNTNTKRKTEKIRFKVYVEPKI